MIVLIGQGLTNKDIANRLCISGITVRHHLTIIFDKLGVTSRQKLLIRAHHYGLVALTASAYKRIVSSSTLSLDQTILGAPA